MTRLYDADGTPLRRTPSGELVPDLPLDDPVPAYPPGARCAEHGPVYGELAAVCRCCWSEVHAGDRPRAYVGRHHPGRSRRAVGTVRT